MTAHYLTGDLYFSYLMELTLKMACTYNVGDCRAEAADRYSRWIANPTDLTPEEM